MQGCDSTRQLFAPTMEKSGMTPEKNQSCFINVENDNCSTHRELERYRCVRGTYRRRWKSSTVLCPLVVVVVILLAFLSIVALAFCVHLYGEFKDQGEVVENLRNDYDTLRTQLDANNRVESTAIQHKDQSSVPQGIWEILSVHNGKSERRPTRLSRRRKRNAQNDVSNSGNRDEWNTMRQWVESIVEQYHWDMAKVHLQGVGSEQRQGGEYLLWQEDPHSFHRVGVRFQHNRYHPEIKGIKIDQPGIYVVYSQVVINGTQNSTYRRDCNHETVMIPHGGGTPTVLMSGYLTQDQEGLPYPNRSIPFPRDSSLQMGQFRLLRQSEVRVRIPDRHGDCRRVNFATDVHASYFGLYKIE